MSRSNGQKLEPSKLHPGGWSHVPAALYRKPEKKPGHIAVYLAIASEVYDPTAWTPIRARRLKDRTGIASVSTLNPFVVDLAEWKFIEYRENPGFAKEFRLKTTSPDVAAELEADRREDAEADPLVAAHRGGRPRTNPPSVIRERVSASEWTEDRNPRADIEGGPPAESARLPLQNPRDSLDPSLDPSLDIWCAEAHPTLRNATKVAKHLKKYGKRPGWAALEEVDFQLTHPETRESTDPIRDPFSLAGAVARCYKLDCGNAPEHGDQHGAARLGHHRGRRADAGTERKADDAGRRRSPSPETWTEEPDTDLETDRERQRQKEELAKLDQGPAPDLEPTSTEDRLPPDHLDPSELIAQLAEQTRLAG